MNTFPLENIPPPPKDNRPVATFVILLIIAGCCLCMAFLCSCQHAPRRAASGPDLGAAVKRSRNITETISLAESDNKEVKRAILSLQASNKVLHKLNGETVLILDRADYKTQKLLGK